MLLPKRLLFLVASCCLGITTLPLLAASEPPVTVEIGGRPIVIPMPGEDFVRCDGINPTWDKTVAGFQAASNRLLASFGTKEAREGIRGGSDIDFSNNFNAQTMRSLEPEEVGTKTFASVSGKMRAEVAGMKDKLDAQMKKVSEQGSAAISKEMGVDAALSISDTAVIGFFDEQNKEALGFTMALNVGHKIAGDAKQSRSVVAAYILSANGRLLMLYATRNYTGESDRQEAERAVKAWGDAITAANARIEGKPTHGIFTGTLKAILIGAGIGLLWGLIRLFAKKRATGT